MPRTAAEGFEHGACAYERGRPGYPPDAVAWLTQRLRLKGGRTVLDVGAGTGKLTRLLVPTGARVFAVEPLRSMREPLERSCPEATVLAGTAEALPLGDACVDALVCAQAFHWFDGERALQEFRRVMRPGGRLALIWNRRRPDQPLQREISRLIEPYRGETPSYESGRWRGSIERTRLFTFEAQHRVPFEQEVDLDALVDRVASISFISALPTPQRDHVLGRTRALASGTVGPLRLQYFTDIFGYAAA